MTLPNFLLIGAAKSGTTTLYHCLAQHPQVFTSEMKEPAFFAFVDEELNFTGPGDRLATRYTVTDLNRYQALFQDAGDALVVGEGSTEYLHNPRAPERIKQTLPDVKLIAVLRHPVERAYSAYLMHRRMGTETLTDFETALRAGPQRTADGWLGMWDYFNGGCYYTHLKRYYDRFPRDQIQVYLYEDLQADPVGLAQEVYRFLGVDTGFTPDPSIRQSTAGVPKQNLIQTLWVQLIQPGRELLRPYVPQWVRTPIMRFLRVLQRRNTLPAPPLFADFRRSWTARYEEEIVKLGGLIQRDLSAWLILEDAG